MYIQGGGPAQALLFAVPNGEERHPAVAAKLSGISEKHRDMLPDSEYLTPFGQGVVPGAPDLVLVTEPPNVIKRLMTRFVRFLTGISFFAGQATFIEVKTEADVLRGLAAGVQSRGQRLFMVRARALGLDYRLIRNPTEFWDLCAEKGVHLRVHRPFHIVQQPLPKPPRPPRPSRRQSPAKPEQAASGR